MADFLETLKSWTFRIETELGIQLGIQLGIHEQQRYNAIQAPLQCAINKKPRCTVPENDLLKG